MVNKNMRNYYKNQYDLGCAIRDYIDAYFDNQVREEELAERLTTVVQVNRDKFFKGNDIALKPKQILGKTRLNVLKQIIEPQWN